MYGELPLIKTADGTEIPGYPIQILNPPKTAVVRLPTNDELMVYLSAQKSIYRDLGRRMGESEDVPNPKADQTLFRAIRLDKDGEEFDDAEALYAIGIITRHKVTNCERDGQEYVITLNTLFGETVHRVCIPYQKEINEYRRMVYKSRDLPHGMEERRFPPEVPVKLYDSIIERVDGYMVRSTVGEIVVTTVPPHHKRAVIIELMTSLSLLDPDMDPNS